MKLRKENTAMHARTLIIGTSLLALITGCTSESSPSPAGTAGGVTVVPQTNATGDTGSVLPAMSTGGLFGGSGTGGSSTAGSGTGGSSSGGSTTGLGGGTGGGTLPGGSTGGGGSLTGISLTNGSDGQSMNSFWQCTGLTDTSTTIQFAWFADATGLISFDGTTAEINWDQNSSGLYMTIVGDPTSVTFTDFSALSDTEFQATFSVSGAGSAPLVCGLYDMSGTPLVGSGEQPINTVGGGSGTGSGTSGSASVSMLSNDIVVASGESMWFCQLSAGGDMGLYLESNGSGFYFDQDYPDGIDFLWDLNSSLDVAFSTGDYFSLSMPTFSSGSSFTVTSIVANGNQALGGAVCELYDFAGNPL